MSGQKTQQNETNLPSQTKHQNSEQPCTEKSEVPLMYPLKELSTEHDELPVIKASSVSSHASNPETLKEAAL